VTDPDLAARIRASIERHLPPRRRLPSTAAATATASLAAEDCHPSHAVYVTVLNPGDSCVIEPGVGCSHCNYCKSHGY
jgi:hypothetical protein